MLLHDSPQQENVAPISGVAVEVMEVPVLTRVVHAEEQLIPSAELISVPAPMTETVTVRLTGFFWASAEPIRLTPSLPQ